MYDLYEMKQFHWLHWVAKNCDWTRKITPLSNLTWPLLLVEWKLTSKTELNCEIYKSWRNAGKNKSVFVIGAALWAEKLWRCIENCRSWKSTLGKLVVAVNLEAIWFEFWMNWKEHVNDGRDFLVFCGWWFSNQFDIVSKTHLSCDTVGHKLWLAILSSLLCPEMDRDICIGKQGCVYFIWF